MPYKILLLSVFVLLFSATPALTQTTFIDSVQTNTATTQNIKSQQNDPDDEFNLFLFLFAAGALSFIAGFTMLGIAAFLLLLCLIIVFIFTGILSTSVFIGWINQSYKSGVKSMLFITGSICGIITGTISFGAICLLFKISPTKNTMLISGAVTGLTGGLLCSYIVLKALQITGRAIKRKWNVITNQV